MLSLIKICNLVSCFIFVNSTVGTNLANSHNMSHSKHNHRLISIELIAQVDYPTINNIGNAHLNCGV